MTNEHINFNYNKWACSNKITVIVSHYELSVKLHGKTYETDSMSLSIHEFHTQSYLTELHEILYKLSNVILAITRTLNWYIFNFLISGSPYKNTASTLIPKKSTIFSWPFLVTVTKCVVTPWIRIHPQSRSKAQPISRLSRPTWFSTSPEEIVATGLPSELHGTIYEGRSRSKVS